LKLKRLYHRTLGCTMIAGARFIIATSDQERRELCDSNIDAARLVVRRNGIDRPKTTPERGEFRKRWGIAQDTKIVLFLGRIVSKKSPDLLIKAFANWTSQQADRANSKLVLAGPEENDGFGVELRSLVQQLGIFEDVLFVGPLYDEEKWRAYRDADVFVLPSQNENFGNAAAESAVCGTPIIVTDQCGIASYVGTAGLVIRHDQVELERALEGILGNSNRYQGYKEGCVQMAAGLSWEEPLNQTQLLYQRCLSEEELQEAVV
jgi:glycosyltransferase involved in cell wall biosynthesis